MKNIFFTMIMVSTSAFADTRIYCSEGDYDTDIQISDHQATVRVCNTDWSCYGQTEETFTYSAELSDSNYSRFVAQDKAVQLEVSKQIGSKKEIEVKLNNQRINWCYLQ